MIKARTDAYPHYDVDAEIKNHQLQNEVTVSSGWSSKDMFTSFINGEMKPITDKKEQETTFHITKTGAIEMVKKRSFKSHVISVLLKAGNTQSTGAQLIKDGIYFDYPKPVDLVKYLITMNHGEDFVVLDFFAGSGTTAQAVFDLNFSDQGNRKFICVQLPEIVEKDTQAAKAGFVTVSDQCAARIRIASKLYQIKVAGNAFGETSDFGFKMFKQDKTSFNIFKPHTGTNTAQLTLSFQQMTDKPLIDGWANSDLTTELMLLEGFPLHSSQTPQPQYTENEVIAIASDFNDNTLYLCLDPQLQDETVESLAIGTEDVFICLDAALTDIQKIRLDDKLKLKTV